MENDLSFYEKKRNDYDNRDNGSQSWLYLLCGVVVLLAFMWYYYNGNETSNSASTQSEDSVAAVGVDEKCEVDLACETAIDNSIKKMRANNLANNNTTVPEGFFSINFPDGQVYHSTDGDCQMWSSNDFEYAVSYSRINNTLQASVENSKYILTSTDLSNIKKKLFTNTGLTLINEQDYLLDGYLAHIFHAKLQGENFHLYYCVSVIQGVHYYILTVKDFYDESKLSSKADQFIKSFAYIGTDTVAIPSQNIEESPNATPTNNTSSIIATKMQHLYVGIDNPIEIKVPDVAPENLEVKILGNGDITKKSAHNYYVHVKSEGNATIDVWTNIDGQHKKIASKTYKTVRIPNPIATIDNKRGGTIAKSKLVNSPIKAVVEDFDFNTNFSVCSFTVYTCVKGFVQYAESISPNFTPEQKKIISNVPSGNTIIIENIKAKGSDGTTRDLRSMTFKLQ